MKKILCAVLIAITSLFLPVSAFADTQNVTSLQFNDIESMVNAYNQDVRANNSTNTDYSSINSSITNLTNLKAAIDADVGTMQAKLSGLSGNELDIYTKIISLYNIYSGQIQGQIGSLQGQLNNSWSTYLRSSTANYAIINSTQQLFILYSTLQLQKEELSIKADQVNTQLNVAKLQKDLGMLSESAFEDLSVQAQETDEAIKALNENMDGVKSQINLMLGQSFDSPITIGALPIVDDSTLAKMNYNTDLETGRIQNFDIRLLSYTDLYKIDDQTRKYKFTFDQKYKAVFNSKKTLKNETAKLSKEEEKLNAAQLKYDAGLISKVDIQRQSYSFRSQLIKVKAAQKDLLQAYTSYQWLLRGYETR